MNDIVKAFPLGVLLRNFFAGIAFIGSYLTAAGVPQWVALDAVGVSLGVSIALTAGVFTYAIHRTTLNALLEWIRYLECSYEVRRRIPMISDRAARLMIIRWGSAAKPEKRKMARAEAMTVWADYIHLMYSSGLCIIAGALLACYAEGKILPWDHFLGWLTVLLLVSGFIADWRRNRVEDILLTLHTKDEKGEKRFHLDAR